ncbi:hypothetical protein Bca4012_055141 [Brassica carinata]
MRLLPRKRRSNIRQMCPNMSKLQAGYLFPEVCICEVEGIAALLSSLDSEGKANFVRQCGAKPGDLILFGVGPANKTLDRLRLFVAHDMDLIKNALYSVGNRFPNV